MPAKSSNDHENVSWLNNGTIKRSKRHILKKYDHAYYSIVYIYIFIYLHILLNNKAVDSLPYQAWPDGTIQSLYSPCSGTFDGE